MCMCKIIGGRRVRDIMVVRFTTTCAISTYPGADPGFQVRGAHLKKLHRAEGAANILGYFV